LHILYVQGSIGGKGERGDQGLQGPWGAMGPKGEHGDLGLPGPEVTMLIIKSSMQIILNCANNAQFLI